MIKMKFPRRPTVADIKQWLPRAWFKAVLGLTLVITCLLSPSWGSDPDLTYGPVLSWGPLRYADPNGFLLWMLGAHTHVMNTNNKDINIIIFIIIFYVGLVVKAVSIVVSVWAVMLEVNARGASEIQKYRRAGKLHISAGLVGLISVCIYIGKLYYYILLMSIKYPHILLVTY